MVIVLFKIIIFQGNKQEKNAFVQDVYAWRWQ
jgi:hypothetical protein